MWRSTPLFLFLSLVIGFVLFQVKYAVVEIEKKLVQITQQIKREKENIHILKAEWSHLNEPQRLQKLAEKFLDIKPMKAEQIVGVRNDYTRPDNFKSYPPSSHLASLKGEE